MDHALTEAGRAEAAAIGARHGVPADAIATLLVALRRGGGRQAQFSHPALGGMGQWSRGGGTMVGEMFNHSLRAKVEQLCNELSDRIGDAGLFAAGSGEQNGDWWPRDLGRPSSVGSQNEEAYACFPDARRLAIRDAGGVRVFDTGEHRISGVSQQQGGSRDLVFTSQQGLVRLHDLRRFEGDAADHEMPRASRVAAEEPAEQSPQPVPQAPSARVHDGGNDILATLERLHELQRKGVLTEAEFGEKKRELLSRL